MELMPQQMVVGLAVPAWTPGMPGGVTLTADRFTRLFGELSAVAQYRQLQLLSPTGAVISGDTPENGLNVSPPLVQLLMSAKALATEPRSTFTDSIYRTIFKVLGAETAVNLGIRTTWYAPAPGHSAKAFSRTKLAADAAGHLEQLNAGNDPWVGVKIMLPLLSKAVTVTIEPLHADDSLLFIEASFQDQGEVPLDAIKNAVEEAENFVTADVRRYLERCAGE